MKKPETTWCEQLYEAKSANLLLYGRALGLDHCEAEDILQETFIALMRLTIMPDEPEHYCLRTFRNRAMNYRRGLWRRCLRELESHRWFERASVETSQEKAAMHCLAILPPEQREVIVLKIWHQYTFEAIAAILECPANTVAGRYRYGLQKLRACLKDENYERTQSIGETIGILDSAPPLGEA